MSRREFRELASPETVRETIAGLELDPGTEEVHLGEARGRILATRVDAALDVPGFDRATMDGYALRAADTYGADEAAPAELTLVGAVHAGEHPAVSPGHGEAVEISTGAVLPADADAVVPVERTDSEGETVLVRTAVAPGASVMYAGADIAAGQRVLGPGRPLSPREIGLLAALGHETVLVHATPRVGIVSTGDELVRPGTALEHGRGEIYDVNSYAISSAVADAGGEPVRYDHVGDDMEALEQTLHRAADECDLVCSSGSTSASAVDVIYRVIEERGELLLHGAAVKPGKPMLVGRLGGAPFVGLPGYPVSAMLVFREFVAPALRTAAGRPTPAAERVRGRFARRERFAEGRLRLLPVGLVEDGAGELLVYPVDRGSGATTSLVEADGLVTVPPEMDVLEDGVDVDVTLFAADVDPPPVLGVGEDDPVVADALDAVPGARYLAIGAIPAARRLRQGVPDVAVTHDAEAGDVAATWTHEWGLAVPAGNPAGVDGVASLLKGDLRLANRTPDSWLRTALDDEFETAPVADIDGYGWTLRGHESPARAVARGAADVGLALERTARKLELEFVPCGTREVHLVVNPDRVEKTGVKRLCDALA